MVSFDFFSIPTRVIKGLIPATIAITSLNNVLGNKQANKDFEIGKIIF